MSAYEDFDGKELYLLLKIDAVDHALRWASWAKYTLDYLDNVRMIRQIKWFQLFEIGVFHGANALRRFDHLREKDLASFQGIKYELCIMRESKFW